MWPFSRYRIAQLESNGLFYPQKLDSFGWSTVEVRETFEDKRRVPSAWYSDSIRWSDEYGYKTVEGAVNCLVEWYKLEFARSKTKETPYKAKTVKRLSGRQIKRMLKDGN